jgi:catechol 1,2-dioxygenase
MIPLTALTDSREIQILLDKVAGIDGAEEGRDQRLKQIVRKMVADIFDTIDRFDPTEDEFWRGLNFLTGGPPEFGVLAPGLGFERFLDLRMDEKERARGALQGRPRIAYLALSSKISRT